MHNASWAGAFSPNENANATHKLSRTLVVALDRHPSCAWLVSIASINDKRAPITEMPITRMAARPLFLAVVFTVFGVCLAA